MSVFSFIKIYLRILKYPLMFVFIAMIIAETLGRVGTYFGAHLIGLLSTTPLNRASIFPMAVLFICLYAGFTTLRGIIANSTIRFDARYLPFAQGQVTQKLFAHIHRHSPDYFEQEMSGNIASKINNVVTQIERLYYTFIWSLFQPFLVVSIILICISLVHWQIGLILLGIMCLFFWRMYINACRIAPISRKATQMVSLASAELIDSISNSETVKSFGHSLFEKKHYFKTVKAAAYAEKEEIRFSSLLGIIQGTLRSFIQTLFYLIPLFYWYYGDLSLTNFVFIQGLTLSLNNTIAATTDDFVKIISHYTVAQEALDLLFKPISVMDKPEAQKLHATNGHIQFNKISFQYSRLSHVFKNFSLDIKPGQKLGLMGYSGCGKSSLIKLIARYYDPQKGCITIDGQNIADVTQESLHAAMAMIPQEPSLLNRTIMENIRYAKPHATDKEVFAAAKLAYCHDFIIKLPSGYDSLVGERGIMLSGGERQRIAIARAILKDAPILILDEATSALDSESEKFIQKSLADLMRGKTVIAIAHRLSTLNKMDKIVVLDKGKIIEYGSPKTLLRQKGTYYHFHQMQSHAFLKE